MNKEVPKIDLFGHGSLDLEELNLIRVMTQTKAWAVFEAWCEQAEVDKGLEAVRFKEADHGECRGWSRCLNTIGAFSKQIDYIIEDLTSQLEESDKKNQTVLGSGRSF